ncbi:MAG: response regulator [Pseudazoarcus pumilus]|nr:response regulator [Pseudazoarcus pumilus]
MAKLEQLAVMVVAANQSMRAHLRTMLDNFGMHDVQFATSAATAIRKLREQRYDLILSEHDLGDDAQDGQHLLEDLRTRRIIPRATVFIMISGERSYERVVGTAEFAPDDYVLKPFTPGILQARIERAMQRRDAFLPVLRLLDEGRIEEAMASCKQVEARHPAWRNDFLRLRADTAIERGELDLADSIYRQALDNGAAPWAQLGHARVLIATGLHDQAVPLLEQLVSASEHYLEAYDLLAQCREHAGQTGEACETLNEAVRRSPRRLGRLRQFGNLATRSGEYAQAEQALRQVVHLGKRSEFRDPADHVELARVQMLQHRVEDAASTVQDLERSMGNQPAGRACAALGKALLFQHTGDEAAARTAAAAAAAALSDAGDLPLSIKHEIVRACLANGLDGEGGQIVSEILRHAPDEQTIRATRELLAEQGRGDLSQQVDEKLHAEVRNYVAAGAQKAQAGDHEGAVSEMMGAVRKMPGNPLVLFNAALAVLRHIEHTGWNERMAEEARTLIARTRKLDPANPKLDALTTFMAGLERKYGMQPHLPAASTGTAAPRAR